MACYLLTEIFLYILNLKIIFFISNNKKKKSEVYQDSWSTAPSTHEDNSKFEENSKYFQLL